MSKKCEVMAFNQPDEVKLRTREGKTLKVVTEFKYLGARVSSTEKDLKIRKGQAWAALHKLNPIWRSSCSLELKRRVFVALVESILLYGATSWTLSKSQERSLDGTYTNMLRKVILECDMEEQSS